MNIKDALKEKILLLDGATGTALASMNLGYESFGGEKYEGLYEILNLESPDVVLRLHRGYLDAGADIVKTNSFSGSPIVLEEFGVADRTEEINEAAARLARKAVDSCEAGGHRWVAGSIGPGTKSIQVTGRIDFDGIAEAYYSQVKGLIKGGVDYLLIETCQDTLNVKAMLEAAYTARKDLNADTPVAVSITIETTGTMLAGQNVEAAVYTLAHYDLLYLGLNCATGPEFMTDHLRTLAGLYPGPVAVVPNAGLPNVNGEYEETPKMISGTLGRFVENGWVNLLGGCCGTTAEHIRMMAEVIKGASPRIPPESIDHSALAGAEALVIAEDNLPILVGERTNVIGSRKFKRLVSEEKFEEAAEVGKGQTRAGAGIIDLCASNPDRDEKSDFLNVLKPLLRKTRTPVMIDTTDPEVVLAALKNIGGRPVINSVNLEDGGEKIVQVAALARKYGANLVVGLIDEDPEQGMAITVERKLEIAERAHKLLVKELGFDDGELIFDPLTFPCGTGDKQYIGSAKQTIEGVRAVKKRFPRSKTILGISNVSFGLPKQGREVLNGVFLYHCVQAGLDFAIVNTASLRRYASIPEEERELSLDLLLNRSSDPVERFVEHFRDAVRTGAVQMESLPVARRLELAVIDGIREDLIENIDLMLEEMKPLDIINGPLMDGMVEVGVRFGKNQLIIAEVLESAEIMKAAVSYIESKLPPGQKAASKGKMILATVKGDVHDIGKNLVDMILSNNGFEIVNLGIKVPPEKLIAAVKEHQPDLIGLSGLLVKSAHMMVTTAEDLKTAGINLPLIVGGAVLTKGFTATRISPAYGDAVFHSNDAMQGLDVCRSLMDGEKREALYDEWREIVGERLKREERKPAEVAAAPAAVGGWKEIDIPGMPSGEIFIYHVDDLESVFEFINLKMLYGKHLGLLRADNRVDDPEDRQAMRVFNAVQRVMDEVKQSDWFKPRAVCRWVEAWSEGDSVTVAYDGMTEKFDFPRERKKPYRCAADWVAPKGMKDSIALFVTTCGEAPHRISLDWKESGRFLDSYVLQALAIETAEALAEIHHKNIREKWGIGDEPGLSLKEIFKTHYRGIRLSFGYPACPDLEEQKKLFRVLKPEKNIGVRLTSGMMMDPEASVSALVFHHPDGGYFKP